MSYHLEVKGIIITDEDEFRKKMCGICKSRETCEDWEISTGQTLYTNENRATKEPLIAHDGTKGVFRCASYGVEES